MMVSKGKFVQLLDSREGIEYFLRWTGVHGIVINEYHEGLAKKHGVPVPEGVIVSRMIPLNNN